MRRSVPRGARRAFQARLSGRSGDVADDIVAAVTKRYKSGLVALDSVDLDIARGEIFALLGPTAPEDDPDRRRLRHGVDDLGTGPRRRP